MLNKIIQTTQDRDTLIRDIDILINSLYKSNKNLRKEITPLSYEYLTEKLKGEVNQSALIKLKENLLKIPILGITLAFTADQPTIKKICQWVDKNTNLDCVIHISGNPSLIGGAQIEFNGRFLDDSLKKKIEERNYGQF